MGEAKFIHTDSLRFIDNIHTTSRQLGICTQIIKAIGKSNIPKSLLETILINQSAKLEDSNPEYNASSGKLTESGKQTTAIKHYLVLCEELGLVRSLNHFYSNTRLAFILLSLLPKDSNGFRISSLECIFYLYLLLSKDADAILLSCSIVESAEEINQRSAQEDFLKFLNERLAIKQNNALPIIRQAINEKYRTVNFIWKNATSYAEHILVPRYSWLSQLGLMNISRSHGNTNYSLTLKGRRLQNALPGIETIKDINDNWLKNKFFSTFETIYSDEKVHLTNIGFDKKQSLLAEAVSTAVDNIQSSAAFKAPLFDTVLYACLYMYNIMNICVEINETLQALRDGLFFKNRSFSLKEGGRINESYLLIK